MRTPEQTSRFAIPLQSVRILGMVIALLLGTAVVGTQRVETTQPVRRVAAGAAVANPAHDLDVLAVIQEAIAVSNRFDAIAAAEQAARDKAKADADAKQQRLDQARAEAKRASRAGARMARQPSGNCTTGSANPGVADPCGCESADVQGWSPGGTYYGKYQYGKKDWEANGGDPAKYGNATEAEQDEVARNTHYDAWPNC